MVSGILLARTLGPAHRGEVASIVTWATVLAAGADFGIGFAVSYFAGRDPARAGTLFVQSLLTAALVSVPAWLVAALCLGRALSIPDVSPWAMWLGLSAIVFIIPAGYLGYLLLGVGRIRDANIVRLIPILVFPSAVIALRLTGASSPNAYICAFWVAQLVGFICVLTLSTVRFRRQARFSCAGLGGVLRFGMTTQVASLAAQANLRLDQLLISLLLTPTDLGFYVVAVAASNVMMPLFAGLAVAATPLVVREPKVKDGATLGAGLVLFGLAAGLLGALLIGACLRPLIRLAFGTAFLPSAGIALILLAATVFQGSNQVLGATLRALGRPKAPVVSEVSGLVVGATALAILLPMLGTPGAAIAAVLSSATAFATQALFLLRVGQTSLRAVVETSVNRARLTLYRIVTG